MFERMTARQVAVAIALAATVPIAGALVSEHVYGLVPCKLCLMQRQPYYWGIPLAVLVALAPARGPWLRLGLGILALLFAVSAGLGAYHAGVEWGWFLGPSDCGGGSGSNPGAVGDFLNQLNTVRVVSCTEAAFRFLGLSLAGWNVLASLAIAALAAFGAARAQGSSSVSQYR
jgi:disulfide bond formation protein DsbB